MEEPMTSTCFQQTVGDARGADGGGHLTDDDEAPTGSQGLEQGLPEGAGLIEGKVDAATCDYYEAVDELRFRAEDDVVCAQPLGGLGLLRR
jgi:hypothetical protein